VIGDEADAGIEQFLGRRGVTWTALVEALGQLLDEGVDWVPEEAVARARAIDRGRYSRRPKGDG
jgi:hypothetical protein